MPALGIVQNIREIIACVRYGDGKALHCSQDSANPMPDRYAQLGARPAFVLLDLLGGNRQTAAAITRSRDDRER